MVDVHQKKTAESPTKACLQILTAPGKIKNLQNTRSGSTWRLSYYFIWLGASEKYLGALLVSGVGLQAPSHHSDDILNATATV